MEYTEGLAGTEAFQLRRIPEVIIGVAQIKPVPGAVDENIGIHRRWIQQAAEKDVDVLIFPELSLTGYEPGLAKELAMTPADPRLQLR